MYLDEKGQFVRTDIWREGKWVDLWSVAHLLSGITMGFFPRYFSLEGFAAYVIVFLLLVLYEMFEALAKIAETPQNRTMDVVIGMASFIAAYLTTPFLSFEFSVFLSALFLAVSVVFSFIGWQASKKASVFEAKLRERIEVGRERYRERKELRRLARARRRELKKMREMQ